MMTKKSKAAWVAALRSGEYKKTTGYLKTEDGFCCLGVLRELEPGVVKQARDGNEMLSPASCGLSSKVQRRLATMNDTAGISFTEIAEVIAKSTTI